MLKNMKALFAELVEYYCLDAKKTVMDEFFAVIYKYTLEYVVTFCLILLLSFLYYQLEN